VEWFSYKNDPHISKLIVMVPKERMDGWSKHNGRIQMSALWSTSSERYDEMSE
jgi:hypothetical protein